MERQSDEIVACYTDQYREDLRLAARPQARLERTRTVAASAHLLARGIVRDPSDSGRDRPDPRP